MASGVVKLAQSTTAGDKPASLVAGQLAVNHADRKLYALGPDGQTVEDVGATWVEKEEPFDWNSFCGGVPGASWVLGRLVPSTALKIVQASCSALAGTAFTNAWTATLYATPSGGSKTAIGTVAFGGTVGTVTITTAAVAAGTVLELDAPSTADSTGADVSINIAGLRQ